MRWIAAGLGSEISFPEVMKFLRESNGMSARGLSTQAGVSPSYVSKMERGELVPTLDTFAKLVKVLKCNDAEIAFLVMIFRP